MSQIKLKHSGGNSVIIAAPDSNPASDRTLKLPSNADGTVLTTTNPKAGNIIQVVSTTKTDTFSATSTGTPADITGLSVSITPSSNSNKIFIMYSVHVAAGSDWGGHVILLLRDSTAIASATDVGNRSSGTSIVRGDEAYGNCVSQHFLDSPATTSATTYKLQHKDPSTNNLIYINRTRTDNNDAGYQRLTSSITVMEVAA